MVLVGCVVGRGREKGQYVDDTGDVVARDCGLLGFCLGPGELAVREGRGFDLDQDVVAFGHGLGDIFELELARLMAVS